MATWWISRDAYGSYYLARTKIGGHKFFLEKDWHESSTFRLKKSESDVKIKLELKCRRVK